MRTIFHSINMIQKITIEKKRGGDASFQADGFKDVTEVIALLTGTFIHTCESLAEEHKCDCKAGHCHFKTRLYAMAHSCRSIMGVPETKGEVKKKVIITNQP